jgi:hypothetical protein
VQKSNVLFPVDEQYPANRQDCFWFVGPDELLNGTDFNRQNEARNCQYFI